MNEGAWRPVLAAVYHRTSSLSTRRHVASGGCFTSHLVQRKGIWAAKSIPPISRLAVLNETAHPSRTNLATLRIWYAIDTEPDKGKTDKNYALVAVLLRVNLRSGMVNRETDGRLTAASVASAADVVARKATICIPCMLTVDHSQYSSVRQLYFGHRPHIYSRAPAAAYDLCKYIHNECHCRAVEWEST